jgi:aspartyl protease family protein
MWRYVFLAVSLIGFSFRGPELMQMVLDAKKGKSRVQSPQLSSYSASGNVQNARKKLSHNPLSGRTARARMSRNGHFYFNTKMNGAPVKAVIDTGASGVAINRTTARRLGIHLTNSDFRFKSRTANGIAYFAAATIDEIEIGRIVVHDVRAAVLKDSSLDQTLLGMTFLRKLRKFEINRDTLILTQ